MGQEMSRLESAVRDLQAVLAEQVELNETAELIRKEGARLGTEMSRLGVILPEILDALAEHGELHEILAVLRRETAKLSDEIGRQKDGVASATRAGLDVLGERARQRRMEGYDDAHDDGHEDFSLTAAAIAYALDARLRGTSGHGFDTSPPVEWPWMAADWKPKPVRQSLVVAAALIIAEIERLDRGLTA